MARNDMRWIKYCIGKDEGRPSAFGNIDPDKIVQVIECAWDEKSGDYHKPYAGMVDGIAALIQCVGDRTIALSESEWARVKPQLRVE